MKSVSIKYGLWAAVLIALFSVNVAAQNVKPIDPSKARVIDHWTSERRANAIPRDLVIDSRGLGYLRGRGGALEPYGHSIAAKDQPMPMGKPTGGASDTTLPTIAAMNPVGGAVIGASYPFSATVTDASGIKSVTFYLQKTGGVTQSFSAGKTGDQWSVSLQGFTDGDWEWWVVAKDNARNTATSEKVSFTVNTGGGSTGGGISGDTVTNAEWTGGVVQTAAGRIYFEMPTNLRRNRWAGYVCSGTVATDGADNRSIIITAAHCVYDDVNKRFARNVLFIPNQDGTTGTGTDRVCSNDPLGCWVPSFGVVDTNWTNYTFPNNIPWDYAYYVVPDSGAHTKGLLDVSETLDIVARSLSVSFGTVASDLDNSSADFTHALGYSYSDDPNFMYCAEDMTTEGTDNWWLPSCELSGGSSGGPWVQPMDVDTGNGLIISVNSWGYTTSPGMAGPKLVGTSAECVFNAAKINDFDSVPIADGYAGVTVQCP